MQSNLHLSDLRLVCIVQVLTYSPYTDIRVTDSYLSALLKVKKVKTSIYIAHRRKCLWCTVYTSTLRNVLSDRPKTAAVCDGSRKFLGSEFQNIGPATEKARRPYVVSRCHQLMASSGTKMLSRLERGTQLDTGEQNHTDICVWSHRVCTWHARVRQASGAQYASAASDPVELPCTTDHTNCRVQHSLQLVGDDLWSPGEDNVTASHTRCWAFVIINIFKTL